MMNTKLPAGDVEALKGIAELVMWLGWDRVADAIYAAAEGEEAVNCEQDTDDWSEVFAN